MSSTPKLCWKRGANNLGDDMPITEEATGEVVAALVEPVSGGVTADGAQLPEDVDVVKNNAMVSFPALGMSKLNARY
ncbi:hypothetical protein Bca52824_066024 [Brassica carinata]|uniref:Uncharacterized protein n=1 Tax=Brassica carinata TaxID=52824 RepID=A0A8X7UAK1_BRACI|nr:hypothetical protein Bca52824_066024 [Brassica carinata]